MKRFLLFASAVVAAVIMVTAQNVGESSHSPNLTLEWYASPAALGDGFAVRAGIGTNGKFYVIKHGDGVYVFDKTGASKKICPAAWISINCDDAGHVYFRNDKNNFPGPEWAGWFVNGDAQFSVIDSKTDEVIKENVPMNGGNKCRFDALPHIMGDMTTDSFELSAPVNATAKRVYNWLYQSLDEVNAFEEINIEPYFAAANYPTDWEGNNAGQINTLANAQHYRVNGVDYMAILPNANYALTFSANGWGNCITEMVLDENELGYVCTGKFFNTPNHSGVGGFHIFQYKGENYIVYPTGQQEPGMPSADGFAVMKQELVDTPTNSVPVTQEDLDKTVAIHYATEGLTSSNNWRGINVEPVEGEDGKFTIYLYCPGVSMQVWTLDLSDDNDNGDDQGDDNNDTRLPDDMIANRLINGNFEDTEYIASGNPYWDSYPLAVNQLESLPGWEINTPSCWNGICQINTQEPDGNLIFEGNKQYLQMHNCTVNGWTPIRVNQLVEGLTPGKTYHLDFLVSHSYENSMPWAHPTQGFRILEKPENGEALYEGKELVSMRDISNSSEFEYYSYEFVADDDAVVIELWCQNLNGEGNESGVHVVNWDEVRLYDPDEVIYDKVETISNDFNSPVEYYTLQGIRVPTNSHLNGVYIAKQGNRVTKVVF